MSEENKKQTEEQVIKPVEQVKETEKKTKKPQTKKPKEEKNEKKENAQEESKSKTKKFKSKKKTTENKIRNLLVMDATNLITGRLASWAAKQALLGNNVVIVNSENAILTGDKHKIFARYQYFRRETGTPFKGPFISRSPDRLLRRIIKKMLPFKRSRGVTAFHRVMCYLGVPKEFEGKAKTLKEADVTNRKVVEFTTIKEVCKLLGFKR